MKTFLRASLASIALAALACGGNQPVNDSQQGAVPAAAAEHKPKAPTNPTPASQPPSAPAGAPAAQTGGGAGPARVPSGTDAAAQAAAAVASADAEAASVPAMQDQQEGSVDLVNAANPQQEARNPEHAPVAEAGPHVFTNKDLQGFARRLGAGSSRPAIAPGANESSDESADTEGQVPALTREQIAQQKEQAAAQMKSLTAELDYLKKQVPGLHNPFLPHPQLTSEDKNAEEGLNNKQRLDLVNSRIAEAQHKLDEAQGRIKELENTKPADEGQDASGKDGQH